MDERLHFVARLLERERMAAVCREFDISRKTGYKLFERYRPGLKERIRAYRTLTELEEARGLTSAWMKRTWRLFRNSCEKSC